MSAPYDDAISKYPPYPEYENVPMYNSNVGHHVQSFYPQHQHYDQEEVEIFYLQHQNYDQGDTRDSQSQQFPPIPPRCAPEEVRADDSEKKKEITKPMVFIRKVYLVIAGQYLFTLAIVILFSACRPIKNFLKDHYWIIFIPLCVTVITFTVLFFVKSARERAPVNFVCFSIYVTAFSFTAACISGHFDTYIVLIALAMTIVVCIGLMTFTIQKKIEFTKCSGILFVSVLVVVLFGIAVGLTFAFAKVDRNFMIVQCAIGFVMALLFSLYLVYDSQMIMRGEREDIGEEEYALAAFQLYVDMVMIIYGQFRECRRDEPIGGSAVVTLE